MGERGRSQASCRGGRRDSGRTGACANPCGFWQPCLARYRVSIRATDARAVRMAGCRNGGARTSRLGSGRRFVAKPAGERMAPTCGQSCHSRPDCCKHQSRASNHRGRRRQQRERQTTPASSSRFPRQSSVQSSAQGRGRRDRGGWPRVQTRPCAESWRLRRECGPLPILRGPPPRRCSPRQRWRRPLASSHPASAAPRAALGCPRTGSRNDQEQR